MFLKSVLACDKKPVSTLAVAWRHHLFVPGGQPLPAVRVPASGPPTACTWLSQHLSLQAQSHFRIPKSIPTAALSLPTTSLTQSWGFNTKSPSQTWPCDPVIRTKYSVTPKSPSWPCRPRGGPANLGVTFLSLPFAAHTLATTWSRWPGPTIYPAQAPSWFLWGFGDFCFFFFFFYHRLSKNLVTKKYIYRYSFKYIGGSSLCTLWSQSQVKNPWCGRSSVSHPIWWPHLSAILGQRLAFVRPISSIHSPLPICFTLWSPAFSRIMTEMPTDTVPGPHSNTAQASPLQLVTGINLSLSQLLLPLLYTPGAW